MSNDIVIIIDCWAGFIGPTDLRTQMCKNIVSSINHIDPYLVVLGTYGSNEIYDDNLKKHNPWIKSFWQFFPEFKNVRPNDLATDSTHSIILNSSFNCEQIALTQLWQLEYILNKSPNKLERAWYFGLHWNSCVKDREIGWFNLKNHYIKNKNRQIEIMTRENCTLKLLCKNNTELEVWPSLADDQLTFCKKLNDNDWVLQ